MYAIVKTGGKQYKVAPGDKINIEKLEGEVGDTVNLDTLLVVDGDKVIADAESLAGYGVSAKIVEQFKGDKVFVVKFHKRKNYKRRNGHRQQLTRVEILSIGQAEAPAAAEPEEAAPEAATGDAE